MAVDQFADVSKDLCAQIKTVEHMLKQNLYREADALMPKVTKCCRTLESLVTEDHKIQNHILANRQKEISWIQDTIQNNIKSKAAKSVRKRSTR